MFPLIGIPCEKHDRYYRVLATYTHAVEKAGGVPLAIPLELEEPTLRELLRRVDGLLLAGGGDVDPVHYGEPVEDFCGVIESARDETELRLTRWALATGKPVLGICRGVQLMNVATGGSLYQDQHVQLSLDTPHRRAASDEPGNLIKHEVVLESDSRLAGMVGPAPLQVNSRHHQSIKQVAPGLRVVGRAPDGIVEAVEVPEAPFVIGVQFHPENLVDDDGRMLALFRAFVRASEGNGR